MYTKVILNGYKNWNEKSKQVPIHFEVIYSCWLANKNILVGSSWPYPFSLLTFQAPSVLPVVLQSASSDRPVATGLRPRKRVITHTAVDGRNPANQLIASFSHHLQGLIHLRWCKISAINSITKNDMFMSVGGCLVFYNKCREIYQSHGCYG